MMSALLLVAAGCGKKSSTTATSGAGIPSKVVISPTIGSINRGSTLSFSAAVEDVNGTVVANQTITFKSSNTSVLTIASSGLACGGTWDSTTTPVVCTSGPAGTAQVTAVSGSLTSDPASVSVHDRIDKLVVSPTGAACVSQGQTLQFTAQASSNGVDITGSVGPVNWVSTQAAVATVDATGLVTAATPGQTTIIATITGIFSVPVQFNTCAVDKINLHVQNSADTAVTLAAGATQQFAAEVFDTRGANVNNAVLQFTPTQPVVSSIVAPGSTNAGAPGTSSVVASCTPPNCNVGLTPVYSNMVSITVSGTLNATTVYAASTTGTSLVPIDTSNNTAGTAITLPQKPNSIIINSLGTRAFLGSDNGLMQVDLGTNAVSTIPNLPGKVLAVSRNGIKVLIAHAPSGSVLVFDSGASSAEVVSAPGATSADCTPDTFKCYIAAGNTIVIYQPGVTAKKIALSAAANDLTFLTQGAYAYVAGGSSSAITAWATCDNTPGSPRETLATPSQPVLIRSLPNSSRVIAASSNGLDVVSTSQTATTNCSQLSDSVARVGVSLGTPRRLVAAPDSSRLFVIADAPSVLAYTVADGSVTTISLVSGATTLAGDIVVDGTQLWVGASDGTVHLLDLTKNTDSAQVAVSFNADLVAVKPK